MRSLLHRLATADDNQAVRRLAIVCLKNGSAHRDTIALLEGLADDDRQERELRETAAKVAAALKKKGALGSFSAGARAGAPRSTPRAGAGR